MYIGVTRPFRFFEGSGARDYAPFTVTHVHMFQNCLNQNYELGSYYPSLRR